jgi:hypothetical protein
MEELLNSLTLEELEIMKQDFINIWNKVAKESMHTYTMISMIEKKIKAVMLLKGSFNHALYGKAYLLQNTMFIKSGNPEDKSICYRLEDSDEVRTSGVSDAGLDDLLSREILQELGY